MNLDFSANHGWTSDELNTIDVTKNEALKKYLAMAQADISSVEVPPVTDAELEDIGKEAPKMSKRFTLNTGCFGEFFFLLSQ